MNEKITEEVEKALEKLFPLFLEKYSKVYSKDELLTREEFLESLKDINQRFEKIDNRFEKLIDEMKEQRGEFRQEMEKQRGEFRQEMEKQRGEFKQEFQRMDDRWTAMYREITGIRKGMGSLGDRAGHGTEKIILGFWRDIINERFGVNVDDVRELVLVKNVGTKQRRIERQFDMYIDTDPPYVFEVKFCPSRDDIDDLIAKCADFEKIKNQEPEIVLISQELRPSVRKYAVKQGIHVVGPAEDPPEVWDRNDR